MMLNAQDILQERYELREQLRDRGKNFPSKVRETRQTWLAWDLVEQQTVIVKVLPLNPQVEWEDIKLFQREAKVLQHLNHPHIPRYLDSFSRDRATTKNLPLFCLVQEHIPGASLQQLLKKGREFSEAEVKDIAAQLLEILIYLHELSPAVLHRDIKPSNILLNSSPTEQGIGKIYLVDFGAVQDKARAEGATFTVVGTGGYSPPEQLWGKAIAASDLYALGATLVHLLTRTPPGELPHYRCRMRFRDRVHLSEDIAQWLEKLIEPASEKRFQAARQALLALKAIDAKKVAEKVNYRRLRIWAGLQYATVLGALIALPAFSLYRYIHEGKNQIDAMNRNQQTHYTNTRTFSDSFKDLDLPLPPQTSHYNYSILITPSLVLNYAIPRKPGLKGYVGAVFKTQSDYSQEDVSFTVTLTCESLKPDTTPKLPVLKENWLECASNSINLDDRSYDVGYLIEESSHRSLKRSLTDFRNYWKAKEVAESGEGNPTRIAKSIDSHYLKAKTLFELGHLEEAVDVALSLRELSAQAVYEKSFWQEVAPQLETGKPLNPEVKKILSDDYIKARALLALEQIEEALEIVPDLRKEENREEILKIIASETSVDRVIEIARSELLSEGNKAILLSSISQKSTTAAQIDRLLDIILNFSKENQVIPLSVASQKLTTEIQVDRVLEVIPTFSRTNRAKILSHVVGNLVTKKQVDLALKLAQTASDNQFNEYKSKHFWEIFVPKLITENQIDEAFKVAENFSKSRGEFLEEIAPILIEERHIDRALKMVKQRWGERGGHHVILTLLHRFTRADQYNQALVVIQGIKNPRKRGTALLHLGAYKKALEIADHEVFPMAIHTISSPSDVDFALEIARNRQENNQEIPCGAYNNIKRCPLYFLLGIAPKLTTSRQKQKAIQFAENIKDEYSQARAFAELGLIDQALNIAENMTGDRDEEHEMKFLEAIAPKLKTSEQVDKIFAIASNSNVSEEKVLKQIVPYLKTEKQHKKALEMVEKLDPYAQAIILIHLRKIDRALALTEQFDSEYQKAQVFAAAGEIDRVREIPKIIIKKHKHLKHSYYWQSVISKLISFGYYQKAIEVIFTIEDGLSIAIKRDSELERFPLDFMTPTQLEKMLQIVQEMKNTEKQETRNKEKVNDILEALIRHSKTEWQLEKLYQFIQTNNTDHSNYAEYSSNYSKLSGLAWKFIEIDRLNLAFDALDVMVDLRSDLYSYGDSRLRGNLEAIAPKLKTQAQFDRALEIARSIKDEKESRIAIASIQYAQKSR